MEIVDLSRRRGAIVHMLSQVYDLMRHEGIELPNMIIWKQEMGRAVIDINRRYVFALEGTKNVHGILFYRVSTDGRSVFLDSLIADGRRSALSAQIIDALLKKFEQDNEVKSCESIYIGRDIKREAADEILETVGLQDDTIFNTEGYQLLGGPGDAFKAIRIRYG